VSTATEAAEALGVTSTRMRQIVLKGELAAKKIGRDLVITAVAEAKKRKTMSGTFAGWQETRATKRHTSLFIVVCVAIRRTSVLG